MANYSCVLTTYLLVRVHPLQTNGQRRRTTTMPIARPLLKYDRLKCWGPYKKLQ